MTAPPRSHVHMPGLFARFVLYGVIESSDGATVMIIAQRDPARYHHTPNEELRYIKGLLNLPFGYIEQFRAVPAEGHERCTCGRTPSALDIIYTALKKGFTIKN